MGVMFHRTLRFRWFVAALAAISVSPLAGNADDHKWSRHSEAEADIEELEARIRFDAGQWPLHIKYEVEIEDACADERFDLVLQLMECDRLVVDPQGQQVVITIPLDRPIEVEDDGEEARFRDLISVNIPDGSFAHPRDLRVEARVVPAGGGCALDDDDTNVCCERVAIIVPPPPPPVIMAPAPPPVIVAPPPPPPVIVAPPAPPPPVIRDDGRFIRDMGAYRQGGFYRQVGVYREGGRVAVNAYGTRVRVRW